MHRFQTTEKLTPTETNRGSRENSLKKKSSTVFVDSAKKNKKKSSLQNLGFEYDHDVTNDTDFCKRIIEKNCYVADYNSPSLPKSTFSLNALAEVTNKKRDDTSILVEGKAGPSHPLRLAASLSEVEPEVTLSKYAQKKLGKKAKSKNGILLEDVYLIKLNWLRKMAQIQSKTHKHNLNTFRLIFEEIIEEISPAFEVQMFSNQKQVTQILRKLSHFLAKLEPQKAILLSYKLFKMHLKQLDLKETQSRMEVAKKLHSFLLPYARLMEIKEAHPSEKDHKERTKLVTYRKIIKFINGAEITNILLEYPDPKKTVEYTVRFQAFLGQRLSLEQAIAKLNRKNKEIIEEMPIDSIREYEEKIEHEEILKSPILLDIPTHHYVREIVREIPERTSIDKSFENARSFELEESFSEHRKNVLGYDFNERCCNLGKAEKIFAVGGSNPKSKTDLALPKLTKGFSKESNNNASIESSNEDQGEGSDSEVELMKDPELYQAFSKNEVPADRELPKLVLDENLIRGDKRAFSCIAVKSRDNIESPSKKLRTSMHLSRQGSGNKDGVLCCDDINTKADPMRISHKPDFVRLNSFENLAHSEEENKKANDNQSPSQKHNGEGKSDLGVIKRPSICQSRLTVNKTKREITFQKIINIAYDEISKWETVINTPLIRIQKIRPENSPVVLLRAWTCIEGFTPKEVFEQIYDTTQRAKWDTVTVGLRVIEYLEDNSEVIYFYIKTPFGITERDFVQRRDYTFDYPEKDTIIMSFQSCLHPSMPPYKNRIRGETHLAGYIIKPSVNKPGSTDLCILSQVDIKGSVPKAIVNMVAAKAPADWVNKLRKACEKTRHQK